MKSQILVITEQLYGRLEQHQFLVDSWAEAHDLATRKTAEDANLKVIMMKVEEL